MTYAPDTFFFILELLFSAQLNMSSTNKNICLICGNNPSISNDACVCDECSIDIDFDESWHTAPKSPVIIAMDIDPPPFPPLMIMENHIWTEACAICFYNPPISNLIPICKKCAEDFEIDELEHEMLSDNMHYLQYVPNDIETF